MVNTAGEAGVDMIADQLNQILLRVAPAKWKYSIIVNCYKRKPDALERGNYWRMILANQILKRAERVAKTTGGQ